MLAESVSIDGGTLLLILVGLLVVLGLVVALVAFGVVRLFRWGSGRHRDGSAPGGKGDPPL